MQSVLPMIRKGLSRLRPAIAVLLMIAALLLIARSVDGREVGRSIAAANRTWLLLAVLFTGLHIFAKVVRWHLLLGERSQTVSFKILLRVLLIGQMLNMLVPLRLGDVARMVLVGREGAGRAFTAGTIAMEKSVDLLSYSALFFCSFLVCRCQIGLACG